MIYNSEGLQLFRKKAIGLNWLSMNRFGSWPRKFIIIELAHEGRVLLVFECCSLEIWVNSSCNDSDTDIAFNNIPQP